MYIYIPDIFSSLNRHLVVPPTLLLGKSKFTLDNSGVVGVFGGDEAISAMATIHVCGNRQWLGWYNSPGSYEVAKQYGRIAAPGFSDRFFLGANIDPATLFNLDGRKGPKYRAVQSGTIIEETGHLAALLMEECASLKGTDVKGRKSQQTWVAVADLKDVSLAEVNLTSHGGYSPIFAGIPIFVSLGTCAACGIFRDWYAFTMILLGILVNGITYLVIGCGKFTFTSPKPAEGSPAGDGILASDKGIVLLLGAEGAVNRITRGRFSLDFPDDPNYQNIGWCSILFTVQFIAQLLLIPQASLFGQIMFVASLAVSWIYNSWLSSKKTQREILLGNALKKHDFPKYILGTRTTMVVFILLVLQIAEPRNMLNELLPNDTNVWRRWRGTIVERLDRKQKLRFTDSDWKSEELTEGEQSLLANLYGDAESAFDGYEQYLRDVAAKK